MNTGYSSAAASAPAYGTMASAPMPSISAAPHSTQRSGLRTNRVQASDHHATERPGSTDSLARGRTAAATGVADTGYEGSNTSRYDTNAVSSDTGASTIQPSPNGIDATIDATM